MPEREDYRRLGELFRRLRSEDYRQRPGLEPWLTAWELNMETDGIGSEHRSEDDLITYMNAWNKERYPHFFEPDARRVRARVPWIVFDEIHKATGWRTMVKGWYDVFGEEFRFLVTGSARLDLLRRGGDSLVGRSN